MKDAFLDDMQNMKINSKLSLQPKTNIVYRKEKQSP